MGRRSPAPAVAGLLAPGRGGVVLGVDPGAGSGALAVVDVDARRVLGWWAYLEVAAGARARGYYDGKPLAWEAASLTRLAAVVAPLALRLLPSVLVLEGLFQARRSGLLVLAESAGIWRGLLEPGLWEYGDGSPGLVRRPPAAAWRAEVLGLGPRTDADRAEETAVRWARKHLSWEHLPDGLTRVEEGAVCEAACMACSTGG